MTVKEDVYGYYFPSTDLQIEQRTNYYVRLAVSSEVCFPSGGGDSIINPLINQIGESV